MQFAVGEIAFGRSCIPGSGTELVFFTYPLKIGFVEAKALLSPDLDLSDWREERRETVGTSFLQKLFRNEQREFVRFIRP